jgi:pSer/pThr/pTyr-binding forkhead associated (FHA) protein
MMMLRAFEVGTDTQEMWDRLHMNCLRAQQEQDQMVRAPRSSLLSQRLRSEPQAAEYAPSPTTVEETAAVTSQPAPVSVSTPAVEPWPTSAPRFCFLPLKGQHRIALPHQGEIVLGRFDLVTHIAPDVDLSYDDREHLAISRRHARIIAQDGRHEIEDMGSTNGTRINGMKLGIGQQVRMRSGDRIALGYCQFTYLPMPEEPPVSRHEASPATHLWVSFTGQLFPLPTWGELVIGRSDLAIGLTPDIDLSDAGEAAQVVARRHVKITARSGQHYVEDLSSANGTKVNGVRLQIGELRLLNFGDHLWLGGCVLAYDIAHRSRPTVQ